LFCKIIRYIKKACYSQGCPYMFKILHPFHIYAPTPLIINKINKLSESYLLKKPKSTYTNNNNIFSK
jgi:hypothetical protein